MTNSVRTLIFGLVTGLSALGMAQPVEDAKNSGAVKPVAVQPKGDAGERAFSAHCSRCHNPPEQLNPRITGTIVQHMRVRANLSEADENALRRFFNP